MKIKRYKITQGKSILGGENVCSQDKEIVFGPTPSGLT